MKTTPFLLAILFSLLYSCNQSKEVPNLSANKIDSEDSFFAAIENNTQWPSYRGYFASGYINNTNLPDSFNVKSSYNIRWNINIPGLGLSCPSIWDDKVFITTAISEEDTEGYRIGRYGDGEPVADSSVHVWKLYCIDKLSGEIRWEQIMHKGIPSVKRHPKSSHANTTVATDGKHVLVFLGSEGLYCYSQKGKLLWKRDFGLIMSAATNEESTEWEFCSSPIIFQDKVIIQADALNISFVGVLDLSSGETLWRKERDEITGWCTPNIYFQDTKPRVVVNGYKHRGAYDLYTGEEVWKMSGGGDVPIPTPIVWKNLLYFNSAHGRHAPMMAINNDVIGDLPYPENDSIPGPDFAWFYDRAGSYMSSVLVYDDLLYRLRWNGTLACYDARTGNQIYNETVQPTSFIASPIASDGKIYLVSEKGIVYVVKAGKDFKILKALPLEEISLVTPGISKDVIIFRTESRLIAASITD